MKQVRIQNIKEGKDEGSTLGSEGMFLLRAQ